ncbi:electron transfer complex subunit TmcD [Salidesulfovibrio onnuriiensis]|uniref:electron transfer complex subunit TmcD n=1 Tax=Salidesulfovibrio onnuriiensis TaxID=2583823 RepID=UPI0011C9F426|nr:WD40 repeat domain-containing protein [Salidesulfovibrio onnuriiensis]
MQNTNGWNWEPGRKVQDFADCAQNSEWLEEWCVSPDGESVAQVACTAPAEFAWCINGKLSENVYEKIICPKYTTDGKLIAFVSQDMEWFLCVDDETGEEGYGFLWDSMWAGGTIAAGAQQDMQYGMVVNGTIWENLFENANNFVLSPDGRKSAAAVQVKPMAQADIYTFQEGIYQVAVDGEALGDVFMNVYTPSFNQDGSKVAAQVRETLYDYSIAVDGKAWGTKFQTVWEPRFNPKTGAVVAPVRQGGKWGMAQDGQLLWSARYAQLWQQQFTAEGDLWAICATDFGKFNLVLNDKPFAASASVICDMAVSPDGKRAAAMARHSFKKCFVLCDSGAWSGEYDMVWKPVFSPDSANIAVRVDRGSSQTILVNGKAYGEDFDQCFEPVFSPDSSKVLIKARKGAEYLRIVADVSEFK